MSNTIESIEQGNKLIAEFMQFPLTKDEVRFGSGKINKVPRELLYHSSWDWLMPIFEIMAKIKIKYENADEYYNPYPNTFGMVDEEGNYMVRIYANQLFHAPTLIEAAWMAVVDFLQWYNKIKNQIND